MTPSTAPTDGTGADSESAPEETIPHLGETLSRIDPDLGNPTRLGLVASLKNRDRAEFKLLRDSLGVSDSVLSRHITAPIPSRFHDLTHPIPGLGCRGARPGKLRPTITTTETQSQPTPSWWHRRYPVPHV